MSFDKNRLRYRIYYNFDSKFCQTRQKFETQASIWYSEAFHEVYGMLRAIIFDCDGVIVDSEPHHFKAFQQILREEGIPFTKEEYFNKYLALDDKAFFETALTVHEKPYDNRVLKALIIRKMEVYRLLSQQELFLYPGVVEFAKKAQS